ncbi:MAG: hypothetical protein P8Y75_01935 [Nitrospirota bacterium]|jgi:hypothetical protein
MIRPRKKPVRLWALLVPALFVLMACATPRGPVTLTLEERRIESTPGGVRVLCGDDRGVTSQQATVGAPEAHGLAYVRNIVDARAAEGVVGRIYTWPGREEKPLVVSGMDRFPAILRADVIRVLTRAGYEVTKPPFPPDAAPLVIDIELVRAWVQSAAQEEGMREPIKATVVFRATFLGNDQKRVTRRYAGEATKDALYYSRGTHAELLSVAYCQALNLFAGSLAETTGRQPGP